MQNINIGNFATNLSIFRNLFIATNIRLRESHKKGGGFQLFFIILQYTHKILISKLIQNYWADFREFWLFAAHKLIIFTIHSNLRFFSFL